MFPRSKCTERWLLKNELVISQVRNWAVLLRHLDAVNACAAYSSHIKPRHEQSCLAQTCLSRACLAQRACRLWLVPHVAHGSHPVSVFPNSSVFWHFLNHGFQYLHNFILCISYGVSVTLYFYQILFLQSWTDSPVFSPLTFGLPFLGSRNRTVLY